MSIKVVCPHCSHSMTLKTVKAGRFKPACSSCQTVFSLRISDGDPVSISVSPLASSAKSENPALDGTVIPEASRQALQSSPQPTAQAASNVPPSVAEFRTNSQRKTDAMTETIIQDTGTINTIVDGKSISAAGASSPESSAGKASRADTRIRETRPNTQHKSRAAAGKATSAKPAASASDASELSQVLGGYRLLSELGRGGMGAVYLARQLSLARNVALKTIQAHWAQNPRVIARFIREAYAAAQLTHHNVVQIYDMGEDNGTNFFSMELVRGKSLEDLIGEKGKLDPRTAVNCILQSARGLKYAHDNGMVHRDVKPGNLMLSDDGLVKVADLGLVKTSTPIEDDAEDDDDRKMMLASANSKVTGAGSAMGTPAYMSPEQADDAAQVDHRADIYSLGCTFFALLTGKPPFTAGSAVEVITQHRTQPVIRTGSLSADVPPEIGRILQRMTEKKAADRYQDLSETIADLERFLEHGKPASTASTAQQAETLLQVSRAFVGVPATKLRALAPIVLFAAGTLLSVIAFWISWKLLILVVLATALTPLFTTVICGFIQGGSPIADRLRGVVYGASWKDWIQWTLGGLMMITLALILNFGGLILLAVLLAAGLGFAYLSVVARPLRSQREPLLTSIESLLREMRLGGKSEQVLQRFVAENSGKDWEELFSTLFSYDEMRRQRRMMRDQQKLAGKNQFGRFRDLVADRLDLQIENLRRNHERRMLEKLEKKRLKARGLSDADARQQAAALAATMVGAATEVRKSMADFSLDSSVENAVARRERIKAMMTQARTGKTQTSQFSMARGLSWLLPGAMFRFLLGGALLTLCGLWARQNDLLSSEQIQRVSSMAKEASQSIQQSGTADLKTLGTSVLDTGTSLPLNLPVIGQYFNSFASGVLGLMILLSAAISGWRFSLFAISAAALTLVLPVFVKLPQVGSFDTGPWIALAAGMVIMVVGWFMCRRRAQ